MDGVDYAQRVLVHGYERAWLNWYMEPPRAVRAGRPYVYGSPYRPTVHLPGANVAAVAGGTKALVLMERPLTLVELERHELIPIGDAAIGDLIVTVANALRQPIELAHADGERVAFIFKNPRGAWQLSYFEAGVGPTGHVEGEDVVALAAQVWRAGFRRFTSGMVDSIASDLGGFAGKEHRVPRTRLYYIHMPGCHTCAAVRPVVRRFRDAHPNVDLIAVDITAIEWGAKKWIPQVTPTLIKLDARGNYSVFDGRPADDGGRIVAPEEVEQWLSRNF